MFFEDEIQQTEVTCSCGAIETIYKTASGWVCMGSKWKYKKGEGWYCGKRDHRPVQDDTIKPKRRMNMIDDKDEFEDPADEPGFDIQEPIEVGDVSGQKNSQRAIDPASKVLFVIDSAKIRTSLEDNKVPAHLEHNRVVTHKLVVQAKVGPLGIDGKGKYKGKVFFQELIVWFDLEVLRNLKEASGGKFNESWWKDESRYPFKEFGAAIGFDTTRVKIDDGWLTALKRCEFIADIIKPEIRRSGQGTGEFRNELRNFRAVKKADDPFAEV